MIDPFRWDRRKPVHAIHAPLDAEVIRCSCGWSGTWEERLEHVAGMVQVAPECYQE